MTDRAVGWDGFFNARDLGGLATEDGGSTATGRVYRSATLHLTTAVGWGAAHAAGVRTVVSLLNDDEVVDGSAPSGTADRMHHVRVAIDAVEDTDLWQRIDSEGLDGTPLYFVPFLDRHPDRIAEAVRAVADAPPGGVLFHCGAGRDRTGLVAAVLLRLAGVTEDAVIADYVESAAVLPALAAAMGRESQGHLIDEALDARGHTARSAMREFLARLDAPGLLRAGGLDDEDLARARDRLRGRPRLDR